MIGMIAAKQNFGEGRGDRY